MKNRFIFLLSFTCISIAYSQDHYSKQLNRLFDFYQQQNLFNGSVLIAKNGQLLLKKGYGYQNAALHKSNSSKSIFQTYSITKTFTATIILKLIEEKKLSLTDKLSRFYPDFPQADSITIEHLLTHTSGIYDYTRGNNMPDQTEKSFVEFERTKPLDFSPGTGWSYSNSGYYFLGYIIQKVTGISYEQAVAQYIFEPLQMKESGFAFKNVQSKNKAIGYEIFTSRTKKPAIIYDPPGPFAAGGIYSTVEDLYKYYNGLKTNKILSKELSDKAYTVFKNNYGYGWVIITQFDKKTVGHGGAGAGFRSNFVQIPEDDICIILLSNTEKDLNNITGGILKILYDKLYKIPSEIKISKAERQQYVGTYEADSSFIIYVFMEDNKLIAQPSRQPRHILHPEKHHLFYVEALNDYIEFKNNTSQTIDTLIFNRAGQAIKAKRIHAAWGVVGSATGKGWNGPDIKLIESEEKGIWMVKNVHLKNGEIKFRFNEDWTINLGASHDTNLIQEGANIKIQAGLYDIVLDITDDEYPKYKIIKH